MNELINKFDCLEHCTQKLEQINDKVNVTRTILKTR